MSNPSRFEQSAGQTAAPELSKSELATKWAALHRLREAVDGLERKRVPPRTQIAAVITVVVTCLGDLLLSTYGKGWMGPLGHLGAIIAIGTGAYGACSLCLNASRTWAEALDARLAEYSPLNREALIELQQQLHEGGFLDTAIVRAWLDSEFERYDGAAKRVHGSPASRFLQKHL